MGTRAVFFSIALAALSVQHLSHAQSKQIPTARGVAPGVLYAAPGLATVRNPVSVLDSPKVAATAIYRIDPQLPFGSLTMGSKSWGGGLSFRQEDAGASEKVNVYEGSLALMHDFLMLGGTLRKAGENSLNYDAALVLELGWGRLGAIARDMDQGVDRIDVGLAIKLSHTAYFEFDLKSSDPFEERPWGGDLGLVIHAHEWTLGLGYDFLYTDDGVQDGEIHAGVSLELSKGLYLDGHYRLANQEWNADQFSAGLRYFFQ